MASLFRDPLVAVFVNPDNRELMRVTDPHAVPRVGENVRIRGVPYIVERVGYDLPDTSLDTVWIVCEPA